MASGAGAVGAVSVRAEVRGVAHVVALEAEAWSVIGALAVLALWAEAGFWSEAEAEAEFGLWIELGAVVVVRPQVRWAEPAQPQAAGQQQPDRNLRRVRLCRWRLYTFAPIADVRLRLRIGRH